MASEAKAPTIYTDTCLNIAVRDGFLTPEESAALQECILKHAAFPHAHVTKSGQLSKKRNKVIYGELAGYTATFRGTPTTTRVRQWAEMPALQAIRDRIQQLTGQEYHCCVIQLYNTGEVGIAPHRDKEMMPGTIIASVSLGAARTMRFDRFGKTVDVPLVDGSLCLLMPPTNDHWCHSIPKDPRIAEKRMSLVFRNCANMLPRRSPPSTQKGKEGAARPNEPPSVCRNSI